MTEEPLGNRPDFLPDPPAKRVFSQKWFRCSVGPASRSAHVWDRQKSADEAHHPIVGVGDVVKEVEARLPVKAPGNEIGFDLPEVIVELVTDLKLQKSTHPRW